MFNSDIINALLKTNDGRDRKPNLLYMQFGVLAMPRLKLWIVRGENLIIQLLMATDQLLFACFQPYPRPLLLDEFSFKEMRTQSQTKISSCCLYVWCKSRELGGRGSPRFPTPMVESFSADLLLAIKCYWAKSHLELFILYPSNFIY